MYIVLRDALYGAFLIGGLSYLNELYKNNPNFPKITGFLLGAPTGYFLGVIVFLRNNIQDAKNFTYHMILGIILTFTVVTFSLYLLNNKLSSLIYLFNILVLILSIYFYFQFELYKKY